MIIFKDKISGDELFSDTFKMKDFNALFYEVQGKLTTETDNVDESAFGFNASAEEQSEENQACSVSGIDVVLRHKLQVAEFGDKKTFLTTCLKPYLKKIKQMLVDDGKPDEAAKFEKDAAVVTKEFILKKFSDFDIFIGESFNADAMPVLVDWCDVDVNGTTENRPCLYFFKLGLIEEKV